MKVSKAQLIQGAENITPIKVIQITIGVVVITIGGVVVWNLVKSSERNKAKRQQEDNIDDLKVNKNNLTLSESQIKVISNNLYNAMNGVGVDKFTIYSNLEQCKTTDDLHAVIKEFGVKEYGMSGSPNWITGTFSKPLDLQGWLKEELSLMSRDLERVKKVYFDLNVPF